ncbi:MAG TPA: 3-hydroxyacyl-CoA dehydrogenase [Halobacteriales archaeon]|uniref:3-hydroxyacyl-CoA dehydrogenase/enoyl-CoA hydratase family protein n=1 Tax=Candidatus Hikarchaeum yamanae TaxID=2675326 RepID=UPI00182E374D|nr:3-hydroxyacyl-CoA dehydrogenase [Halobacteriales archaeon]|tara:strand:- start:3343 stop:5319 length:1977 start_codon:yes stop_codon:yes gene_type:complete
MEVEDVTKVAVLGAGNMGHGIAEVVAIAGFTVVMRDITEELVKKGYEGIVWSLDKLVEKGQISEKKLEETLERITTVVEIEDAVLDAEVVIEAIPERMDLKKEVYEEVGKYLSKNAVVLSNTSSLSITELSEVTGCPERFCGLHFFNPPIKMPLVEVISGDHTAKETFEFATQFAKRIGKFPVEVRKDSPGFIVNRILTPLLNEAAWIVHEKRGGMQEVESSVKYGLGLPMGAFELSDQVGIDVAVHVLEYLHEKLGSSYKPCPMLEEKIEDGDIGRKVGKGFYDYSKKVVDLKVEMRSETIEILLTACLANEITKLLEKEVAVVKDIDQAMKLGTGIEKGPAKMADDIGLNKLHQVLLEVYDSTGEERYKPTKLLSELSETGEFFYEVSEKETGDVSFEDIEIEKEGKLGKIILNRPHRLNAITAEMIGEIDHALDLFDQDEKCGAILITGVGEKAFCAGADIVSFASGFSDEGAAQELSKKGQDLFSKFEQHRLPIIAGIRGYCFGGGMELAAACDLRIASDLSVFGQPERNLGILPAWGGTQRLMYIMGEARAKEIILTGKKDYRAEVLYQYGFINEVVDDEQLQERAEEVAKQISEGPPLAQGMIKQAMLIGRNDINKGFDVEREGLGQLIGTEDLIEGMSAFMSKRDPEFKGK